MTDIKTLNIKSHHIDKMSFNERDKPLRRGSQLHLSLQLHQLKINCSSSGELNGSNSEVTAVKAQSANSKNKKLKIKSIKTRNSSDNSTNDKYVSF